MVRKLAFPAALIAAALIAVPGSVTGDSSTLPPRIIVIHRQYILPGKLAAYEEIEANAAKTCARLSCPSSHLGLKSLTGPPQVWFLNWFDTYAAIEEANEQYSENQPLTDAMSSLSDEAGSLVARPETLFAEYRPDLSYGSSTSLPAARYLWVQIVTVLPGHSADFETFRRSERVADDRARAGATCYVFHVTSGSSGNVYLVVTLGRSLQEADNLAQLRDGEGRIASDEASGRLIAASVARTEGYLFRPEPAISYLPNSWITVDPSFWAPAAAKE